MYDTYTVNANGEVTFVYNFVDQKTVTKDNNTSCKNTAVKEL